jgi:lipopolysaccharide transport system permease protein
LNRLALSPVALLRGVRQHRDLIAVLASREVKLRFQGSMLGFAWSLVVPLLMLGMYTAVFAGIFKMRWPGTSGSTVEFALTVFVGLLLHGFVSECLARSPQLLVSNVNFIKKVVFPLEILPLTMIAPAVFNLVAGVAVLVAFVMLAGPGLSPSVLWLPAIVAPLVLVALGIAWILAPAGVVVRDMSQIVGILSTGLLFLSPVFYPLSSLPDWLQVVALANPLSFIIEQARVVLLAGTAPNVAGLALYWAAALAFAAFGFACFQVARRWMADFL